uniref:Uncharacterized protein n=1 Tax=Arundo donax TaxID=35708 RepID=A0A0A9G8N5_ARUDO
MLLLFETPSGFAIFNFCGKLIEQPNALENIWDHFTANWKAKRVSGPFFPSVPFF